MAQSIPPALISQSQFESYTKSWSDLLDDNSAAATKALQTLFTAGGQLTNYVYLDSKLLFSLLSAVGTKRVCVRLAVVPSPAILLAISLVLYGVDEYGKLTSGYYMAGTRGAPATVEQTIGPTDMYNGNIDSMPAVSFMQVADWVNNWQQKVPADMNKGWFKTIYGNLRGYTYELKDFWDATLTAVQSGTSELWLSYILHEYAMPGAVENTSLFGLVLTLNPIQDDGSYKFVLSTKNYYYDISRPCPPICG